jgi:hypothetical protein
MIVRNFFVVFCGSDCPSWPHSPRCITPELLYLRFGY